MMKRSRTQRTQAELENTPRRVRGELRVVRGGGTGWESIPVPVPSPAGPGKNGGDPWP
jgi:hypothetical protein